MGYSYKSPVVLSNVNLFLWSPFWWSLVSSVHTLYYVFISNIFSCYSFLSENVQYI